MTATEESVVKTDVPLWRVRLADLRGRGVYAGAPDAHRCIFIHVPKTAGSSVAEALFGTASRHVDYADYLRANPRKFRAYFKFAFVRDPWDRLVSTWSFLKRGGMNERDRHWADERLSPFRDFDHFVRDGLSSAAILSWVHFRPQSEFVSSPDGQLMLDFVGRYERLEADFALVATRLGIEAQIRKSNQSAHAPFATCYTAETADIVGRVYRRDAALFGYKSPGTRS